MFFLAENIKILPNRYNFGNLGLKPALMNNTMRFKTGLILIALSYAVSAFSTGDSSRYLTLKDTIFLEINSFEEKIFGHTIEAKQTLFSLSQYYGLSLEEVLAYNPELRDQPLSLGQTVIVPIPNRAIKRYKTKDFKIEEHIPVFYKVKGGDTMYRIAKKHFKMPIDTLLERNKMNSFIISPGDIIRVGWMEIKGIDESQRVKRGGPEMIRNSKYQRQFLEAKKYKREYNEQGVAFWQKDGKKKTGLYALHRKAPLNSYIAVTNPMKKRTVYVKVIGRLPANVYKDNVVVVVSSSAAKFLGAKDARFFSKVQYLR